VFIKDEEMQATLIASSWDAHVAMAIRSMEEGKITAMEVGGAHSIEECWALVDTYEKTKTLEAVQKWYKKTGVIYEFFDSRDEVYPYQCERKGKPTTPPDWRKQVHSISDFNWSSCFTLMFIQNELYLD
jgi:hypothetical protein